MQSKIKEKKKTGVLESDPQINRIYRFLLTGFLILAHLKGGLVLNVSKTFGYKMLLYYMILGVGLESICSF